MGDASEEKAPASGNISTEEEFIKSEKIEQPSEEKFSTPLECRDEKKEGKSPEQTESTNTVVIKECKSEMSAENPMIVEGEKETENESPPMNKEEKKSVSEDNLSGKPVPKISDSVPYCPKASREKIVRNQSDIFSLKDIATTLQTSIFSVNGSPSRRLFRKQEPAGHVFQKNDNNPSDKASTPRVNRITRENYNDEKRPSSSYRNPLTGSGLSSNDEYKSKGTKRKDGNPLLGLGYDSEVTSASSQQRIPPGGYSHKLW